MMHEVYFLRPVGFPDGPIKIGYTQDIPYRMLTFAQWSPFPLELLASGRGGKKIENRLHEAFAEDRLHFEWFRSSQRLLSLIAETTLTDLESAMHAHGIPLLSPYALREKNVELSADAFLGERAA